MKTQTIAFGLCAGTVAAVGIGLLMFWKSDAAALGGGCLVALALGCAIAYLGADPEHTRNLTTMRKPDLG